MAELVFRICARCPGDTFLRQWNRIFCKWFYPNRCAFSVGGVLDLTYINVLRVSIGSKLAKNQKQLSRLTIVETQPRPFRMA